MAAQEKYLCDCGRKLVTQPWAEGMVWVGCECGYSCYFDKDGKQVPTEEVHRLQREWGEV